MDYELFISGFLNLYNYCEKLTVILIILALSNSFIGIISKRQFRIYDFRIPLLSLIFTIIFLIIGLFLFFLNFGLSIWESNNTLPENFISNSVFDFKINFVNILSVIIISVGWSLHRKTNDSLKKFIRIFVFYLLGLLILGINFI